MYDVTFHLFSASKVDTDRKNTTDLHFSSVSLLSKVDDHTWILYITWISQLEYSALHFRQLFRDHSIYLE